MLARLSQCGFNGRFRWIDRANETNNGPQWGRGSIIRQTRFSLDAKKKRGLSACTDRDRYPTAVSFFTESVFPSIARYDNPFPGGAGTCPECACFARCDLRDVPRAHTYAPTGGRGTFRNAIIYRLFSYFGFGSRQTEAAIIVSVSIAILILYCDRSNGPGVVPLVCVFMYVYIYICVTDVFMLYPRAMFGLCTLCTHFRFVKKASIGADIMPTRFVARSRNTRA